MTITDGYTDLAPGKIASVVTYLEQHRPSGAPLAQPPPTGLTFRGVKDPDPGWYRRLFRTIGEPWLWFSRLQMDDEELLAILRNSAVEVFALSEQGVDKGLLELDCRRMPEIEIAFFGLTQDLIGRGAGRFLMSRACGFAWSHGARRITVHTCTLDHPRALEFYLRSGFTAYRRAVEIADDPRLTGRLPLTAAPFVPVIG